MSTQTEEANFQRFKAVRRRSVSLSSGELTEASYLDDQKRFPLVLRPRVEGVDAAGWAGANRAYIEGELLRHGAVLFRGFGLNEVEGFERFTRAVTPDLLDYKERAAPRKEVGQKVYTSTEYPADQHIPLHHEMSYSHNWPMKLWFYCQQAAQQGGATPIADDRAVFEKIDPKIKEIFLRKKVMYVRNYGDGLDIPWPDVFQTTDRAVVEQYCRQSHTEFEWRDGNRLRTRQVRQVMVTHPQNGVTVWFNHAHMFHLSNLSPAVRESLLAEFGEEYLPRNAYYGDGSPIEDSVLEEIRGIYNETAVVFPWEEGDVMLLDNILSSHGRHPYVGPRKTLVSMAELYINEPLQIGAGLGVI